MVFFVQSSRHLDIIYTCQVSGYGNFDIHLQQDFCSVLFLPAGIQPTLWTHALRPFTNRPIALAQEGKRSFG